MASSDSPRAISMAARAQMAPSWSGWSSRAWRSGSSVPVASPSATSRSASEGAGASLATNSATAASGRAPMNPSTTLPSFRAKTAGIDCTLKLAEMAGFSSTLTLARATAPSVASTTCSMIGPEGAARTAPGRPQVHHHGDLLGAAEHLLFERGIGDVDHRHDDTGTGIGPAGAADPAWPGPGPARVAS